MREYLERARHQTRPMEKRYFHKSSQAVWANLTVSLFRDDAGVPQFFIGVIEDIRAAQGR